MIHDTSWFAWGKARQWEVVNDLLGTDIVFRRGNNTLMIQGT